MLQSSTIKFLQDLNKNNNKPWFEKHRLQYDTAKADFCDLVGDVIKGISSFDKSITDLEVKHCTFRINRDVRFSKNKAPYKNNMAAYFNKDGKKGTGAGYYLHLQPGESFAAGGIWMPEAKVLANIRQEIDYNLNDWEKMLSVKTFRKFFPKGLETEGSLQRPPKGYDINNPAIEYLKMKNFIVSRRFSDEEVLNKNFGKEVTETFRAMKPMIDFFNRAID